MLTAACRCSAQPLTAGNALTHWTFDPLAVIVVAVAVIWYVRAIRRVGRSGGSWAWPRTASFMLGLLTIGAVTVSWIGAYAYTLFWVYTVQIMVLLVISPALIMFGKPVSLARLASDPASPSPIAALVGSAPIRVLSSLAVGPLLLPVVTGLVFFTAVFPASLAHYAVYQLVHLLLLSTGLIIAIPLANEGVTASSITMAAGILFGFLELLADAVPGIAIRLRSSILAEPHYLAVGRRWGPSLLHDQQLGGAIVWFLAETIDLPVLALLVFHWILADEREAVLIDRHLDEEQARQERESDGPAGELQRPWWETDATVFGDRRGATYRGRSDEGSGR